MDNLITEDQWNLIVSAVNEHVMKLHQHYEYFEDDRIYVGKDLKYSQTRHYIYDNYDHHDSPGLDFVISKDCDSGRLTVYNGSEMAYAPVTFEKGLEIARSFFDLHGSEMAEEIVCDYVMDGNPRINLWKQEASSL